MAEVHNAGRVRAMSQAQGMAELMDRLLEHAQAPHLLVGREAQPAQRDHRSTAARLGHPEDEVQIAREEIEIGGGENLAARIGQRRRGP
jgi:hypothetical protein